VKKDNKSIEYDKKDYEFMHSLSAAVLEQTPKKISRVIQIWILTIAVFIIWASYAEIDEITRGEGKVIPYGQNQVIQNLEGGIVEDILVQEGDTVKKGQVLLKINNTKSISDSESNKIKYNELYARKLRLLAEVNHKPFSIENVKDENLKRKIEKEKLLYNSRKLEFKAKDNSLMEQIEQKKQEVKEAKAKLKTLKKSLKYVQEEINMTEPMVRQGIKSKVDFLKLKREESEIINKIQAAKLSIPRLKYAISEYRSKREEAKQAYINEARKELNKTIAEIERLEAQQKAFEDKVIRTIVKSPVNGIIQTLYVHTIGGVVKPGEDLVEIVPTTKKLYMEIKIKPKDIAFIHPGAKAKVKISAYDYSIYGGLEGKVVKISPDTITDKKDNTFYLIYVETKKNHLGTKEKPLKIIPGMTVNVDIVTGKKTIMQYILKPILKSKQYMFTER